MHNLYSNQLSIDSINSNITLVVGNGELSTCSVHQRYKQPPVFVTAAAACTYNIDSCLHL